MHQGGKSKDKGKGKDGGKGKGKDGGKGKGKDCGKGKGKDGGKGLGSYQGYCHLVRHVGSHSKILQARRHLHGGAAEVVVSKCVSC